MRIALLTLSATGLELARRLRDELGNEATIYGPSCVVGRCGRVSGRLGVLETDEPGVMGWAGPLRLLVEQLWTETDALVAIMPTDPLVRWIGPLAARGRSGPAVVSMDDTGRFAIGMLKGQSVDVGRLVDHLARCSSGVGVPAHRPGSTRS